MRRTWVVLSILSLIILAGCNGGPDGELTVTPAPAPTTSPPGTTGLIVIGNVGSHDALIRLTVIPGPVDRVVITYLNGSTRVRTRTKDAVEEAVGAGIVTDIEPIGPRVMTDRLSLSPGDHRTVAIPTESTGTTLLIEVWNRSLERQVETATGTRTVLADAIVVSCRAGLPEPLTLVVTTAGLVRRSRGC